MLQDPRTSVASVSSVLECPPSVSPEASPSVVVEDLKPISPTQIRVKVVV